MGVDYAWYDLVGNVGVVAILVAYALLQTGRLESRDARYSLLNLVGAAFILVSLAYDFNLSAFLIEAFWVAISLVGLVRWGQARRSTSLSQPDDATP